MTFEEFVGLAATVKAESDNLMDDGLIDEQKGLLEIIHTTIERIDIFIWELKQLKEDGEIDTDHIDTSLAFDFRSPINNIYTACEYLLQPDLEWNHAALSKQQKATLLHIQSAASQMMEYIFSVVQRQRQKYENRSKNSK